MFGWFQAWQIGSQILAAIGQLISGGGTSFQIPISVKGHRYILTLSLDPATKAPRAALVRS